jgi:hypothetical protein
MRKFILVLALLFTTVLTQERIIDWHDMSECVSVTMVVGHECEAEKKICKADEGCQYSLEHYDTCAQKCVDDLPKEEISEFPFECVEACLIKGNKNFYNLFMCSKNYCTHLPPPQKLNFLE